MTQACFSKSFASKSGRTHDEVAQARLEAIPAGRFGNPEEFGELYGALHQTLPQLRVIGGCCGTDKRHIGCAAQHIIGATSDNRHNEAAA